MSTCRLFAVLGAFWFALGLRDTTGGELHTEYPLGSVPGAWVEGKRRGEKVPPRVSVVGEAAVGRTAISATPRVERLWQAMKVKLETPVDLKTRESIVFWAKQDCYEGRDCASVCRINFADGGGMYRVFIVPPKGWKKVVLPLDTKGWTPAGKQVELELKTADSIQWYPFRHLDKIGETFSIDGLEFVPRKEETHRLEVNGYRYLLPPTSGDASNSLLTDTNVAREAQTFWRAYSDDPDISFDLGAVFRIDSVALEAVAIPSQNINGFILSVSMEGSRWQPLASGKNGDAGGAEVHQVLKREGLGAVGRYVRVQLTRPRPDFPVYLSEVTFTGAMADDDEIAAAAQENYDVGPKLPRLSEQDYWLLSDGETSARVHRGSGVAVGLAADGECVVERVVNGYVLLDGENRRETNGYNDRVLEGRMQGDMLWLDLANDDLPGLRIRSGFRLRGGRLEQTVGLRNGGEIPPDSVIFVSKQVVLAQAYRGGGVYETWGGGHGMVRRFAYDVPMDIPADSCPTLSFESPERGSTLFHYRYRYNGRFLHLASGTISIAGFGDKRTVLTATGWVLGDGAFVLGRDEDRSVETYLQWSPGRLQEAYARYLALPEVKAFREPIRRAAWLREFRCNGSEGWEGMNKGATERIMRRYLMLLREGYITVPGLLDLNYVWGDLPTEGRVRNFFGGTQSANQVKEKIARLKALSPRLKVGIYTWLWSANKHSNVYRKHPEWFIDKDKNGRPLSFFPNWRTNFYRLAGIRASQHDMFEQVHRMMNAYDLDVWYLDGGGSPSAIDWHNRRIDAPDAWDQLYSRLRKTLLAEDPDRVLFFNTPEKPLGDMGFLESFSGVMSRRWRQGAAWMWKFELWQRHDPLHQPLYIYWLPGVEGAYEAYMVGLGLMPCFNSRWLKPKDVPFVTAQYQTRFARLADTEVTPNWRYDRNTDLESFPMTLGNAAWIMLKSHAEKASTHEVTVRPGDLGLVDADKPVYHWRMRIRNARTWDGRLGEQERAAVYSETGWNLDRAVLPEFLEVTPWRERISRPFETVPGESFLWVMTQSPAIVYSFDGLPTQVWLPDTMGVRVSGETTEHGITLRVESERDSAELGVLLPEGMVPARIEGASATPIPRIVQQGKARMLLVPVGRGARTLTLGLAKAQIPQTAPRLSVTAGKPGGMIAVHVENDASWRGTAMSLNLVKDGIAYLTTGAIAAADSSEMQIPVPAAMEGGHYTALVSDATGVRRAAQTITLENGRAQTKLPPIYLKDKRIAAVSKVNRTVDGVEVLAQGHQYDSRSGTVEIDVAGRRVSVGSQPLTGSHWNLCCAGLEMKVKRFVRLRLDGNFSFFNRTSPKSGRHCVKYDNADCLLGLTFDFHTAAGFAARTCAGLGKVNAKRGSTVPSLWGTKRKPDAIVALSDFVLREDSDTDEFWVDLHALSSPADWDGRVWIAPILQNVCPDRQLSVSVVETRGKLPDGAVLATPFDLMADTATVKTFAVPRRSDVMAVDGKLNEGVWKKSLVLREFSWLGNASRKPPQMTEVRLFHDNTKLYVGFRCEDTEKDAIPADKGAGGRPWQNDSVEFAFKILGTADQRLHAVIDSEAHAYKAIEDTKMTNSKKRPVTFPKQIATSKEKGAWYVEAAVPLARIGVTNGKAKVGFNLMRNRFADGTAQYMTLVPGNTYFDMNRFFLSIKVGK